MSRGGKRLGAGRKLGSINRFSQDSLDRAIETGILPIDYLLSVMRNEELSTSVRIDAAKAAAPFLHHKLSTSSLSLTSLQGGHEEWLASLE